MLKRSVLRLIIVVALMLPSVARVRAQAPETPPPPQTYEEAAARLDGFMAGIGDLRAEIDRGQFDLDALSADLGPDAAGVVAFVREEIAFEQYPGLLRGAQGTLLSRAGNALDQSVLLTTLLGEAGHEARITRGTLSPEQARDLIDQMAAPRPTEPPVGNEAEIEATIVELARAMGVPAEEITAQLDQIGNEPPLEATDVYKAVQADTYFVLRRLVAAGVGLGNPNADAQLVEEGRDYFWVEYRSGPSEAWQAAHPAYSDPESAPQDLAVVEIFGDASSIPADLQHRFRLQVVIEQLAGDELKTYPLLPAWERPAADLVGVPITLVNYPNGVKSPEDAIDLDAVLAQSDLFVPMLNGEFAPGAMAFNLDGTRYELEELAPGEFGATPVGLLDGAGELGRDIGGILGGGDIERTEVPADPGELSAQWVEYTLVAPGGGETTHRRMVVDRIGALNREMGNAAIADADDPRAVKAALLAHHTLMLAPGEFPEAFALDQTLQRLTGFEQIMDLALRERYGQVQPGQPTELGPALAQMGDAWAGHFELYGAFDYGASHAPGVITYRSGPSVVVRRSGAIPDAASGGQWVAESSIDIVSNVRRAFDTAGGAPASAPDHLVWSGVWDTHAEGLALASTLEASEQPFTTMVALERAEAASIPIRVVASAADLADARLELTPEAMVRLQEDLARGYAVLVPAEMPPGDGMTGWWRVDPGTGETLGMTSDGRGQALGSMRLQTPAELVMIDAVAAGAAVWLGCLFVQVVYRGDEAHLGQCVGLALGAAGVVIPNPYRWYKLVVWLSAGIIGAATR